VISISVVICTYNRADGLRQTLDCLRQQRFVNFEVVVVNGPSTDDTDSVCREYGGEIKLVRNPLPNLAVSRNLGIAAAAGDIVAFIDDDALPEPAWLEQAVPHFDDPSIAGVGGIVIDHTGMTLQYRYSAANRFGRPVYSDRISYDSHCVPGADTFAYLQGTNALFRRSALDAIGRFDETFDFYLDETDVCVRLVDHGYLLRQLDVAPVHHKYLPSDRRSELKVVTNWYSIVRNHVYFGYRHALLHATEFDILRDANRFGEHAIADARYHEDMGASQAGHTARTTESVGRAILDGALLGRERKSVRLTPAIDQPPDFVSFATNDQDRMRIALVSSGYPPEFAGGIGRFIGDVAPVLAARGHEVRVFTRTTGSARVDLEAGVWVHRLKPAATPGVLADAPAHVDGFATAVVDEMRRIEMWWIADVAYGSLWDVELLGIARELEHIPVVPMLATPTAEVALHEGWDTAGHDTFHMYQDLVRLERELVLRAALVHGISAAIVDTFDRLYPKALTETKVRIAHIGRSDRRSANPGLPLARPTVLFVGRLEPRKGIDTFLQAAEQVVKATTDIDFVVAGNDSRPAPDGTTYSSMWEAAAGPDAPRLRFVGETSDEELDRLLTESLVVVMPSRYESFGLVVVEAMMHGRAVVASEVGGIPELIDSDVTGVLIPVGDSERLAVAIGALCADPAHAAALGAAGRTHFEGHLVIAAAAERLETLLTELVPEASIRKRAAS
jgi:glycogen(starch) synthase